MALGSLRMRKMGRPLGVVEVGGECDDGAGNDVIEVRLGGLLHLGQDHGDLLRRLKPGLNFAIKIGWETVKHTNSLSSP